MVCTGGEDTNSEWRKENRDNVFKKTLRTLKIKLDSLAEKHINKDKKTIYISHCNTQASTYRNGALAGTKSKDLVVLYVSALTQHQRQDHTQTNKSSVAIIYNHTFNHKHICLAPLSPSLYFTFSMASFILSQQIYLMATQQLYSHSLY